MRGYRRSCCEEVALACPAGLLAWDGPGLMCFPRTSACDRKAPALPPTFLASSSCPLNSAWPARNRDDRYRPFCCKFSARDEKILPPAVANFYFRKDYRDSSSIVRP